MFQKIRRYLSERHFGLLEVIIYVLASHISNLAWFFAFLLVGMMIVILIDE